MQSLWIALVGALALAPLAPALDARGGGTLAERPPGAEPVSGSGFEETLHLTLPGGVEAKGVGLRSLGSGTIVLDEIPAAALVVQAYLYWEILDDVEGAGFDDVTVNGHAVAGDRIGEGAGLCWGPQSTFAYRADVTAIVTGPGAYVLEGVDSGLTDGSNVVSPKPIAEGASLVVVWLDPLAPLTEVTIVDGFLALLGGQTTVNFPTQLLPPAAGLVRSGLAVIGGDGQKFAADRTRLNGNELTPDSWDGSDPQRVADYSIGNLWDTDRFDATGLLPLNDVPRVQILSLEDCLGPEALVLTNRVG